LHFNIAYVSPIIWNHIYFVELLNTTVLIGQTWEICKILTFAQKK